MKEYKDFNDYEVVYMIGEKSEDATNLLFNKYKPVISKIAHEYYRYGKNLGLEYQDFIQEGYLGLSSAIKNYSDAKNILFYTYALICIKRKMGNLLRRSSTKKNYALNSSVSLYSTVDQTDKELIDYLIDENALLPDYELECSEEINKLKYLLYEFDLLKSSVLELKYNGFTNREIAKLLEISASKVSYILLFVRKKLNYYR